MACPEFGEPTGQGKLESRVRGGYWTQGAGVSQGKRQELNVTGRRQLEPTRPRLDALGTLVSQDDTRFENSLNGNSNPTSVVLEPGSHCLDLNKHRAEQSLEDYLLGLWLKT
ncbi:hypothetical protein EYF80_002401 [Liparis tanakae]|uniref:Uncharacterized protein n=1 Tax=Liparis tanakae TaxID=230148 RepID=A0A4Z2JAF3_9TELE|nr:hypothetical protein EYF80_002401 [Liparis tanakae]